MATYLIELGLEEIPARFLLSLRDQLQTAVETYLKDQRLDFQETHAYASPRRLAVKVMGLADSQAALLEEVKGPSLKAAKDEQGEWTKAALGFFKGQGVSAEDVEIRDIKGTDYLYAKKKAPQQSAAEVLQGMKTVMANLHFPVSMRWSDLGIEYIRPVHWIVSLLEDQVVDFAFAGIDAGKTSRGHRFLGPKEPVEITHPDQYEEVMEQAYVLVDFDKRRQVIYQQIQDIAEANNWDIPDNDDLLEEVTSIVEWPTAFAGTFEEEYLELPKEVLVTAMRDHQRYFFALDHQTKAVLPVFISVRNGNDQMLDQVIKGNQKVLRARLQDGLFFYQEDLKMSLEDFLAKLPSLKEHFKLASYTDKQARVRQVILSLQQELDQVGEEEFATALRAADIYKFDLLTHMVDEFSELQGQMGGIYAEKFGETAEVCQAISQQYRPTSAGGDLPDSTAASLLAMADKIDSLMAYFSVGLIPTGSNDPYALRRQAMGIIEIIQANQWDFDLLPVLAEASQGLESDQEMSDVISQVRDFLRARMQVFLENQGLTYDMIHAVVAVDHLNLYQIGQVAQLLTQFRGQEESVFKQVIEQVSRVVNLGLKVTEQTDLSLELAQTDSEKALIQAYLDFDPESGVEATLQLFKDLVTTIDRYFEENMVNCEDQAIRFNRYQLMYDLTELILNIFDPRNIVIK